MITVSTRNLVARLEDWRGSGPAYQALADRIRLLIVDGGISPGSRLPAERELASALGVSRSTIAAAFQELRDQGVLHSVRGSGSVTRLPAPGARPGDPLGAPLDLSKAALPALPGLEHVIRGVAERAPELLADLGFDPIGRPDLRAAIAERYRARGLPTDPDQIMVTSGAQHAIALLARTLLRRGDKVLLENPTYPHALEAFVSVGARLIGVAVDPALGWDRADLDQAIRRGVPALAYLMPGNHNPTGRTMPIELLREVLSNASAQGTTVIVDETMAELSIDTEPLPPAAALGPAILLGSVGKTIWGGLRVGWIRAEPGIIRTLARARFANDLGTPVLDQAVVADLLPRMPEVLRERVSWLRSGREHLLARLSAGFPEWSVEVPSGGLTAWVQLGRPVSSQLAVAARRQGLFITSGTRFSIDGAFERFLRIPYSLPRAQIEQGLLILRDAWDAVASAAAGQLEEELAAVV